MHILQHLSCDLNSDVLTRYHIDTTRFTRIPVIYILNLPITNGSTCWPAQLYHGGRPAVYIVLLLALIIGSEADIVVVL